MQVQSIRPWKHLGNTFLVRDIGKRAICVVVRPIPLLYGNFDTVLLIKEAATFATGRGWKTIIIEPYLEGLPDLTAGNHDMYFYHDGKHMLTFGSRYLFSK